jgi:methionyl-tRNA formyltransferase
MSPLEAVAKCHRVIAVVRPVASRSRFRQALRFALSRSGIGAQTAMFRWAKARDVPMMDAVSGSDPNVASRLENLAPDVICVAAFPWLLANGILRIARRAALNVHTSLLPRHRGPNPLFWVYYHSDIRTGVTVHQMNERADAGGILAQQAFDVPRGFTVDRLYAKSALLGAQLLVQVLEGVEAGGLKPIVQDETSATYAPRIARGTPMVNFAEWDVERVWHFLSGLYPRRQEPLQDAAGRRVRYKSVLGYTLQDRHCPAGTIQRTSYGWNLHCHGGFVQLGDERHTESGVEP